jgi:hypothetical protein
VKIDLVTPHDPARFAALALLLAAFLVAAGGDLRAAEVDWTPFAEEDVVEILTVDSDGEPRETKVWVVVVEDAAYVRTNDSRWLANIRRDPLVRIRVRERELPLRAEETTDRETTERVEEGFKAKYGWVQRMMSALRLREPAVLRLDPDER